MNSHIDIDINIFQNILININIEVFKHDLFNISDTPSQVVRYSLWSGTKYIILLGWADDALRASFVSPPTQNYVFCTMP